MSDDLDLVGKVRLDTTELNDLGSRISGTLKGVAAAVGAAFAVDKVLDFGKEAISAASDVGESTSKVGVVFGQASQSVLNFASNSATAFGQSQAQALEATGTFGNLLRSVGLNEEKSAQFSTTMVGLASDLASFNNTSVDDALEALRSGLVGETEPLKRFGVNLNEATLQQKALSLGLYNGKGPLDANAKAQASYALIMEQTTLAQGDFSRTSGGLANQQRILEANLSNTRAELGAKFLPAVTAATGVLNNLVKGDYAGAAVDIGKLFGQEEDSQFVDVLIRAGDAVQNLAAAARDTLQPVITAVGGFIKDNLGPVLAGLATVLGTGVLYGAFLAISAVVGTVTAALSGPVAVIAGIVIAIGALVGALVYAYNHFEGFRDVVGVVVDFVVARFNDLVAFGREIFPQLQEAVGHVFNVISAIISGVVGFILDVWRLFGDDIIRIGRGAFEIVRGAIEFVINTIANVIRLVVAVINGDWGKAFDAFGNIVKGAVNLVKDVLGGLIDIIRGIFGGAFDLLRNIGSKIVDGLIQGFKDKFNAVKDTLGDLTQKIKDWKGPADLDARLLTPAGESIMDSLTQGFRNGRDAVRAELADLTGAIASTPFNVNASVAGSGAGGMGGPSVGIEMNFYGPTDGASVRDAIPSLTEAIKAQVGSAA